MGIAQRVEQQHCAGCTRAQRQVIGVVQAMQVAAVVEFKVVGRRTVRHHQQAQAQHVARRQPLSQFTQEAGPVDGLVVEALPAVGDHRQRQVDALGHRQAVLRAAQHTHSAGLRQPALALAHAFAQCTRQAVLVSIPAFGHAHKGGGQAGLALKSQTVAGAGCRHQLVAGRAGGHIEQLDQLPAAIGAQMRQQCIQGQRLRRVQHPVERRRQPMQRERADHIGDTPLGKPPLEQRRQTHQLGTVTHRQQAQPVAPRQHARPGDHELGREVG